MSTNSLAVLSKCIGVVYAIRSHTLKVALPNGSTGSVHISQISDSLNSVITSTSQRSKDISLIPKLADLFSVGQLVKCSVLSTSNSGHTAECSLKPSLFNPSNLPLVIKSGLPVWGEFQSKEDNGWIISLGSFSKDSSIAGSPSSISGFLGFDSIPSNFTPIQGNVCEFIVKSFNSRVAILELYTDLKTLDSEILSESVSTQLSWLNTDPDNPQSVSIESILPGQVFVPQSVEKHKSGFLVTFLDDFSANLSMLDCPDEYLKLLNSKNTELPTIPSIRIIKVDINSSSDLPVFYCSSKSHLIHPETPNTLPLLNPDLLNKTQTMYAKLLIGKRTKSVLGFLAPNQTATPSQNTQDTPTIEFSAPRENKTKKSIKQKNIAVGETKIDEDEDSDSSGWESENDETSPESISDTFETTSDQINIQTPCQVFLPPNHFPVNETVHKSTALTDDDFLPPDRLLKVRLTKALHIEHLYQASNHPDIIEARFTKPGEIRQWDYVRALIIAHHDNVLVTVLDPFYVHNPKRLIKSKLSSASRVLSSHIQVRAILPKNQLSDNVPAKSEKTTKILEQRYHKHKFLQCRVIKIDPKSHTIVLSHKTSYLNGGKGNSDSKTSRATPKSNDTPQNPKSSGPLSLFSENLGTIPQNLAVGSVLLGKIKSLSANKTYYTVQLWSKPNITGILSIAAVSDSFPMKHPVFQNNSSVYCVVLSVSISPAVSDPSMIRYSIQLATAPSLFRKYEYEKNSKLDPLVRSRIATFFSSFDSGFDMENPQSPILEKSAFHIGQKLSGYITSHSPKTHFVFISFGPNKESRAKCHLKNLADSYTSPDSLQKRFPIGTKVSATVISIARKHGVEVSLRSNPQNPITKTTYQVGSLVKGRVTGISGSGTFLWVEFAGNYSSRVYKRNLLDQIDPEYNLKHHYSVGNLLTAVVTKIDSNKKTLTLNCKPSAIAAVQRGETIVIDAVPPMRQKRDRNSASTSQNVSVDQDGLEDESEDEEEMDITTNISDDFVSDRIRQLKKRKPNAFSTSASDTILDNADISETNDSDDESDVDDESSSINSGISTTTLKNRGKRLKEQSRKQEEASISEFEKEKLSDDWKPTTASHFESLVLSNPNDSINWLKYAVYYLEMGEIPKARKIFARSVTTIDPIHSKDINNAWIGWINMEHELGSPHQLLKVKEQALKHGDPLPIHMHFIRLAISRMQKELALLEAKSPLKVESKRKFHIAKIVETFEQLLKNKNFKPFVQQLWKPYLQFLLSQKMISEADQIYHRCIQPLSTNKLDPTFNLKKKRKIMSVYINLLNNNGYADRASTLEAQMDS